MATARTCLSLPFLALILLSTVAATGHAQETLPGFAEIVDVRVVNLEVVVTDRQGNRVAGIDPSLFRLRVDGEEIAIDYFSEILEGKAQAPTTSSDLEVASIPAVEPGQPLRTSILVFIDDFFSIPRDRDRVLDNLEQQLEELGPEDRVAMVGFDGKAITLLTGWTGDRREIRAAINKARARPAFGSQRAAELRTNDRERFQRQDLQMLQIERIQAAGGEAPDPTGMGTYLQGVELDYANRINTQVQHSVLAAASAMRSFAGAPGRRVFLLMAGGWPLSPAEYTVDDYRATPTELAAGALDGLFPRPDELFAPIVDTANLLSYTIYAVDVPGQTRDLGYDASADSSDFDRFGPNASLGGGAPPRELMVHASLDHIAEGTGGKALLNSFRDRSLSEAIADTRSFYWLGFTPNRNEDDERHEIEVVIEGRPDLRVRARSGFVDLSRGTEVTMMVESSLLFGDPPSTKPLMLRFGRMKKKLGKMTVPLEVGWSMDEITLIPTNGRWVNEVEIRITVMDKVGNRSETSIDKVAISGAEPPQPGQAFWYETDLRMRSKEHRIVVAVYDPISGTILSSSGEISDKN